MRGRPCKTDGSPGERARREKERMRKRDYLKRRALGQKMLRGRPKKLSVAAEKTDLELVTWLVIKSDQP